MKSVNQNLKIFRRVILIINILLTSVYILIFDLTAKKVNATVAIEKEIPCAIADTNNIFHNNGQIDRWEPDCDSTSFGILTLESAGSNARIAQNYNLHVWVSDTRMGEVPSEYETGNRYYICYELTDSDTGKRVNEIDSVNYTATETIRNSKGIVFEHSYQNSDYNWISIVCDTEDTYIGEVTISGDYDIACSVSFNVRTKTIPAIKIWAWEKNDSEIVSTIGVGKTVHCSYRIRDKITDKNLNDASIGWILDGGYTVTIEIYNPDGDLLKKQSYENSDCARSSFVPGKTGKYLVKVSTVGVFSGTLEYIIDAVEIEHSYSSWMISVQPTCAKSGIKIRKCSICNQIQRQSITKKAHRYNKGVVKKKATCEEKGIRTYTCTVCKSEKDEFTPAIGHKSVIDPRVEPTNTQDGLTEGSHCSTCGKILIVQKIIPAIGQVSDDGKVTKPGAAVSNNDNANQLRPQTITASSKTVVYKCKPFSLKAKASGGGKLTYKSSNKKVAVVSTKGKVTVKSYGETKITIKAAAKGGYEETVKKITVKVVPKAPKLSYARRINIRADKTVSGYEIYFSTKKNFIKNVQKSRFGRKDHGMRLPGLKRNVNYYLKARAYKKVGKKMYYSAWSKVIRLKR